MEMVPIGRIEEVAKQESRQKRYNSRGRDVSRQYGPPTPYEPEEHSQGRHAGYGRGGRGQNQRQSSGSHWQHDKFEEHSQEGF